MAADLPNARTPEQEHEAIERELSPRIVEERVGPKVRDHLLGRPRRIMAEIEAGLARMRRWSRKVEFELEDVTTADEILERLDALASEVMD